MTAAIAETDSRFAQWPGVAPNCPTWASGTQYDGDWVCHTRSNCIFADAEGKHVAVVKTGLSLNYNEDGSHTYAGFDVEISPGPKTDEILLDRFAALSLLRELAIVLEVTDLGPLLVPEILVKDPYQPQTPQRKRGGKR